MLQLDRRLVLAALTAAALAGPAAARAQQEAAPLPPGAVPDRVRVVANAAYWPSGPSYSDSQSFTEYAETTTIHASYDAASAFGPDLAVQVSLYRGLGLLVGYAHASRDVTAKVDVSRPHPLYLGKPRTATAENSGYKLAEGALYLDVAYVRPAGRLEWAVFAGVALFQVEADLLARPTYTDVYPYDELAIASTPSVSVKNSPAGFNVGGRLDYRFGSAKRFGAGVQVLYSTASVELKGTPDSTSATFDAGGLAVGAGVRVYF
jgi:hypothetical protein